MLHFAANWTRQDMAGFRASLNPTSDTGGPMYNGFLFNRERNAGTDARAFSVTPFLYGHGLPFHKIAMQFVPSGSPPPGNSSGRESPSTQGNLGKRWEATEIKILLFAIKENYERLKSTKSSRGKKAAWEKIHEDFSQECRDALNMSTIKTLAQAKEKWRALFERYKAVCDNNTKTGRGRETFEFFEAIDEFMSGSDKVHPRFVKQTRVTKETAHLGDGPDRDRDHGLEESQFTEPEAEEQQKEIGEKRPAATPEVPQRKKKSRGAADPADRAETDKSLLELLRAQQAAIEKSEEKDERFMEAMLKMQADSEKRHRDLMVSVLGKLGDIFSSTKQ